MVLSIVFGDTLILAAAEGGRSFFVAPSHASPTRVNFMPDHLLQWV